MPDYKTTIKEIPAGLIEKVQAWLGRNGVEWFRGVKKKHGGVSAVFSSGGIPHPVHFREGMQVRNFMRSTGLCEGWNSHDYDNNWSRVVEKAIG